MTRSVEIPEQAVVAALGGYDEVPTYGTPAGKRDAMRNALFAALPYLAPACQGNGVCTNPRCPTHGIEWDVPAGDGGLREALEKLAEGWTLGVTAVGPARLRDLLAAHPAAPAVPQPVDREALMEHLRSQEIIATESGGWDTPTKQETERIADAVLAVLAGEQEQVES